jgi:hypothetical protein
MRMSILIAVIFLAWGGLLTVYGVEEYEWLQRP